MWNVPRLLVLAVETPQPPDPSIRPSEHTLGSPIGADFCDLLGFY
jgi:hypothetical protein